jgi:hypothetical protein
MPSISAPGFCQDPISHNGQAERARVNGIRFPGIPISTPNLHQYCLSSELRERDESNRDDNDHLNS